MRKLSDVSEGAANKAGDFLSSKTAIVIFAILPLLSLGEIVKSLLHGDIQSFIAWLSQSFIQLVALAVLAYLARREGLRTEARDLETHDAVMDILKSIHAQVTE